MAETARNTPSPPHLRMQSHPQLHIPPPPPPTPSPRSYLDLHLPPLQFIFFLNDTVASIIPVLLTFMQLKYQATNHPNNSPFSTHPATIYVAVCSSVLYYSACIALLRFSPRRCLAVVVHRCSVWSGYVSVASLASVLLPDSFRPYVYAGFALLSAVEFLYWLYRKLVAEFGIVWLFNDMWRAVNNPTAQRRQILRV